MAIISYQSSILDPNIDTFDNWLSVTNNLLDSMSTVVITTGVNNFGDVKLDGNISVSSAFVGTALSGGAQGAQSGFTITSNTSFIGNEIITSQNTDITMLGNIVINGSQKTVNIATQNTTISSGLFTVNSETIFANTTTFTSNTEFANVSITGTVSSGGTLTFVGDVNFEDINVLNEVTAKSIAANNISANTISVSSAASVGSLLVSGTSNNNILNANSLNVSGASTLNNLTVSGNSSIVNLTSSGSGTFVNLTSSNNLVANNVSATNTSTTNLTVLGTDAVRLSRGTDLQRPVAPVSGSIRFNTQRSFFEGYDGTTWNRFGDNVLSIVTQNGIIVRTAENTAVSRTLESGVGINITNGDGVSGNPSISALFASNTELFAGSGTNKSINAGNIYSAASPVALSTTLSTISINFATGRNFSFTLAGNRTLANPSNAQAGQSGIIIVTQDAIGNRILSYGSSWKFPGGSSSLSTLTNSIDVISYYVVSPTVILCTLLKRFI
jgi:hypothetical protein